MNTPENPSTGPITRKFSRGELQIMLAESIPNNLPAIHGQIVGREKEMESIEQFLGRDDIRLVTLTGFGGIGKTTLAIHTAHAMIKSFPGGVFFIDLGAVIDPELILPVIAKTLNIQEENQRPLSSTLKDFLSNRTILFVLDNFEQLVNGAPVITGLIDSNPCIHLLITSREGLRLRGEQVVPIHPLPVEDATALFIQRAQSLNPDFQTNEGDVAVIAELCARLDGLPLAIELAAMRTKMFAPQTLLARFKPDPEPAPATLDLLASGARDLPARQQTLRNTIAWSYNLLAPVEQKTLRAASLFASGFDLDMLGQLAEIPQQVEILQTVSSLIDKHLIQAAPGQESRFTLLNTIREFGREKIRQQNEWQKLTDAYIQLYKDLAGRLAIEIEDGDSARAINRLDSEHNNLLTALDLALDPDDGKRFAAGIHLMAGLEQYWFQHGYLIESEKYINRALQLAGNQILNDAHLCAILYGLKGTLQWARNDFEGAAKYHQQTIMLCEQCGDDIRLARAMNNLAVNLDELSDYENASRYYETGLALSQKIGDNWNHLRMLSNMGIRAHHLLKDTLRAEGYWQAALALIPPQSKSFETLSIQFNLACMGYARQELEHTAALLDDIIEAASEKSFPRIRAYSCGLLALVYLEQKRIQPAAPRLVEALEASYTIGELALTYELFECIALLSMSQMQYKQAAKLFAGAEAHTAKEPIRRVLPLWNGFDKTVKTLASALGRAAFERAWEEGKNLAYEDLYLLALRVGKPPEVKPNQNEFLTLLTERELDTLRLLARGKTNQEISQDLFVTLKTVEKHVANILHKLGVRNRTEATTWAIQHNLLGTELREN